MLKQTSQVSEVIAKKAIQTDSGVDLVLEYSLHSRKGEEGEMLYSLEIKKSTPDGVLLERETTAAITNNRETALTAANAFAHGTVLPASLLEIADDYFTP